MSGVGSKGVCLVGWATLFPPNLRVEHRSKGGPSSHHYGRTLAPTAAFTESAVILRPLTSGLRRPNYALHSGFD